MMKKLACGLVIFGCVSGSAVNQEGVLEQMRLLDNVVPKSEIVEALSGYTNEGRFSEKWEDRLVEIEGDFAGSSSVSFANDDDKVKDLYIWLMVTKYCCCPTTSYAFECDKRRSIAERLKKDEQLKSMVESQAPLFKYIAWSLWLFGSYAEL